MTNFSVNTSVSRIEALFERPRVKLDWLLVLPSYVLSGLGLAAIKGSAIWSNSQVNFQKQVLFLVLGTLVWIFFSRLDWRVFRDSRYLASFLYGLCLLGLAGLLIFGSVINGSRSWYRLGPFSLDPIEFAKIFLVIVLAKYFSTRHVELYRVRHILVSGAYVLLAMVLLLLQPELGYVIILALLWVGILLVSGIKLRHFLLLCLAGLVVLTLGWFWLLKPYQKARLTSFVFPQVAPLDAGWNQQQAKIAIGSAGLFGKGLNQATQIRYGFLPASQTDFVFAGVVEEFGLVGGWLVLLCFGVLLWRTIRLSLNARSNFPRLFAVGFALILLAQITINIGMNLGLAPVIGIPLPFVSYGGSSLLASFLGMGILQSIFRRP